MLLKGTLEANSRVGGFVLSDQFVMEFSIAETSLNKGRHTRCVIGMRALVILLAGRYTCPY